MPRSLTTVLIALLLSLQLYTCEAARRCFVTRLDPNTGYLGDRLERCDLGKPYCFRGRLTGAGESAIRQLYHWPVWAGRVMRGCVQSSKPPAESMRRWYKPNDLVVCVRDGCNK